MKKYSLEEIAALTRSTLIGNPDSLITGVADLATAEADDASFLSNPRYHAAMLESRAGVIFVNEGVPLAANKNFLIHSHPSEAFQVFINDFFSDRSTQSSFVGIHPTAIIHPSATLAEDVTIGPYAVIDANATIGCGTCISAHSYIGPHVRIGEDCFLHPRVTIREFCQLGNRVVLQPGVVIGSCGFGYTQDKKGKHSKLEQLGEVTIGDDVEIGANTTIDRARFKSTSIGRGTKIDNLVQIAHGVVIGEDCLVIAQTGIAGSTSIGNHVILAGQVAVAGHLTIGDGVLVAGRSGISKSIPKPGKYGGMPAMPLNEHNRNAVQLRKMGSIIDKVQEIEERLNKLQDPR